eukprot:940153-Amphidinium_carterae.1
MFACHSQLTQAILPAKRPHSSAWQVVANRMMSSTFVWLEVRGGTKTKYDKAKFRDVAELLEQVYEDNQNGLMSRTGKHSIRMFMTPAAAEAREEIRHLPHQIGSVVALFEMLSCPAALLEVVHERVDEMLPIPDNAMEAGRVIPFYVTYDVFATVPASSNTQVFIFKTSIGNPT